MFSFTGKSKMEMKQICVSELHPFINGMRDTFTDLDTNLWILKVYLLNFFCAGHNTMSIVSKDFKFTQFSLIYFSIIFLSLEQKWWTKSWLEAFTVFMQLIARPWAVSSEHGIGKRFPVAHHSIVFLLCWDIISRAKDKQEVMSFE